MRLLAAVLLAVLGPSANAADLAPFKERGGLVLYEAATHGADGVSNGGWDGDMVPVMKLVRRAGKAYAEFSYKGKTGKARTVFWYNEQLVAPEESMRYAGIKLAIDYAGDDYAKLEIAAHFRDGSQVSGGLTLEPGEKEYTFTGGFRHAKWPIVWEKLDWVRIVVRPTGKNGNPIRWRLRKMSMMEKPGRQPIALELDTVRTPAAVPGSQPLGRGEIAVLALKRTENRDKGRTADFVLECALRGFAAGAYRARWALDGGETGSREETVSLKAGGETRKKFRIASARNANGPYTFRVTLSDGKGAATACEAQFVNSLLVPDLFGKRLLSPRPKQIVWGQGEFSARRHTALRVPSNATLRTRKTAEIFRDKYRAHTGVPLAMQRFAYTPPARGIVLRLARGAMFQGKPAKLRREGYCLRVGRDRVVVTGGDERGLYYGMITFFQLMKNDWRVREQMPVPCVEVLDWPDLPNRMMMAIAPGSLHRGLAIKDDRGIDAFIDWTDRFVARNKANILYIDASTTVRYERRPEFNGRERTWTLADLRKLGQYCRDNFIDVCPAWQCGGHADWWLLGYHPELALKGNRRQSDVTHPNHNKIVFDCMLDVIEALGCKYASPKGDEWSGETPADVYIDFHVKCRNFLRSKGVRMMMFQDMISPYGQGKKTGTYKRVSRLPKDIIINHWGDLRDVPWFTEKGFEVWVTPNAPGMLWTHKHKVNGFGNIIYSLGNDKRLRDKWFPMNSSWSLSRAADIGWNAYDYPGDEPGRAVSLRNLFALRPTGRAGQTAAPLDLSDKFSHSFGAYLRDVLPEKYAAVAEPLRYEAGLRDVAHVPTRFVDPAGRNCVVVAPGSGSVAVSVGARHASLVFLHTAFLDDPNDRRAHGAKAHHWPWGFPCGEYVVHYADGREQVVPVRFSNNIRRFDTPSRNRGTTDNRYVLVLKDHSYDPIHLFQYEWANPRPDVEIEKIVARHDNELDVSLILFAITGRSVWTPARSARMRNQP